MSARLVLAGSGEFTPAMDPVDRELLAGLRPNAKVAIVPTAAGLEETPLMWAKLGSDHFLALGAEPLPLMVLRRADADQAVFAEALGDVDWIYLSGGHPGHLVETLAGSAFWRAIVERMRSGAILAGSSAGAMVLGSSTFVPLGRGPDGLPTGISTRAGLGLVPGVVVAPHFDILPPVLLDAWRNAIPAGERLVGIDEDTALIGDDSRWSVRGRGRVVVFGEGEPVTLTAGASLDGLLPPLAYTPSR